MLCEICSLPLLTCHCPHADRAIRTFLDSPAGQQLERHTHNTFVFRCADLMDRRIAANESEFLRRFGLRVFPRRKRIWLNPKRKRK